MAKVTIVKLTEQEIADRGIKSWPIWTKEVSQFDWYFDSREQCQILDGEVIVHTEEGDFSMSKTFNAEIALLKKQKV